MKVATPDALGIDSKQVQEFYRTQWNRKIPLTDSDFYDWQFRSAPQTNSKDLCCIAVDDDLSIVGVMGLNQRPFYLSGERRHGAELTTWIVRQDVQKKGVGPAMLRYLTSEYDALLGLGITPAAVSIYLRHGFRFFNPIPRYMRVLNWSKIMPHARIDDRAKKIERFWGAGRMVTPYVHEAPTENGVNGIFKEFAKTHNMFDRDFDFLKWRYLQHPRFKYDVSVVRVDATSSEGAVLVTRLQEVDGIKIAHVVDLYGDTKAMFAALSYLEDKFENEKVDFSDFYSTAGIHQGIMMSSGWFARGSDDFFDFPHLFNPIELRNPSSASMILWSKDNLVSMFNSSSAYISKQDCDFDRP